MNLKIGHKISGFIENIPTIDINSKNQLYFTNDDPKNDSTNNSNAKKQEEEDDKDMIVEEICFGSANFKIQKKSKKKVFNTNTLHQNLLNQNVDSKYSNSKVDNNYLLDSSSSCLIDVSNITKEEINRNLDRQQDKYNGKKSTGSSSFMDKLIIKNTNGNVINTNNAKENNNNNDDDCKNVKLNRKIFNKKSNSIIIFEKRGNNITEWKKKTNILCWWCCHSFDTPPCFIPTKYDERRNRYKITGNFCSWNCAKSFKIHDCYGHSRGREMHSFTYMLMKMKVNYNIKPAPPKQALKAFGGILTIDEFRDTFTNDVNYTLLTNSMELDIGMQLIGTSKR